MNSDDVIPPSPPVKLNKTRARTKKSDATRKKKRRHSILSLRMKNLQQEKSNSDEYSASIADETSKDSDDSCVRNVNIYAGIDDVSAEEKARTMSILDNFDMLGQPKLIEQCNQYDLSQQPTIRTTQLISQPRGFISLKELLSSSQDSFESASPAQENFPCVQNACNFHVEIEARDVSMENIHFSEWPALNDGLRVTTPCVFVSIDSSPAHCSNHQNDRENTDNGTNASSIVQGILNDFDDCDNSSQVEMPNTPPIVLFRRRNRKTYNRTRVATLKTLEFDESDAEESFDEHALDNECDIQSTQYTQDIDLNASRHIVENLTRLTSFFSQPQSHVLDFNADLSQTITLNEEFREFVNDSDDFRSINVDVEEYEAPIAKHSKVNSPSINLLSQEEDIFVNITTPKAVTRFRNVQANAMVSMPLSSAKGSNENSTMHSTPSTSKQTISIEQLVPKRLRFGPEAEEMEKKVDFPTIDSFKPSSKRMPGFATVSGKTFQMSANQMKRTAAIFNGIDNDYKDIDPILEEIPNSKKAKHSCTVTAASSANVSKNAQILDDITNVALSLKPTNVPGSSSMNVGFATARGSAISVSASNVNRYAQTLKEVERSLCKEYGNDRDVNLNDKMLECKTQLNPNEHSAMREMILSSNRINIECKPTEITRNNQRMVDFSDLLSMPSIRPSTAAGPSSMSVGFATARGSNIIVSANNVDKYAQTLKEVDRKVREDYGRNENVSLNDNILECKTPLNKFSHRSKEFATSTPNPNASSAFKNCSPITPINNDENAAHKDFSNWIDQINGKDFDDLFNTQHFGSKAATTSIASADLNDTITNDFQLLNDSITDNEIDVLKISEEIKCERERVLSLQQAECFKKPHPIRPNVGCLLVQKMLSSQKLCELGMPKKYQRRELELFGVQSNVIEVNVDNVLQFKFDMWKFYPEEICRTNIDGLEMQDGICLLMDKNARVGIKELTSAFLQCASVDSKLVPDHWTNNCLKWIITKLASYERSYPHEFAGKCLTPENVLAQLKFRYDREIDKVQRSVIRKMVEQDDTAAKRMILFVSRILGNSSVCSLELSDGWYSIRTSGLDSVLTHAVSTGKISIGTKLVIQGAEIVGFEEACSPLEMPSSVAFKISANSTRRARWHAKLGYCKESYPFAISLNSVNEYGGLITRMKAYVVRVYPMIYAVKENTDDGQKTVFRSNKVEQRENKKYDKKQFELYEKFYSEVSDQVEKEYDRERKKRKRPTKKICDIDNGEELWNLLDISNDAIECVDLTSTQRKMLDDYSVKFNDEKQNKINEMVREKVNEMGTLTRATAVLRVRLIDANSPNVLKTAVLSIWNANESHASLRENKFLDIRYVTASRIWGKDLPISSVGSYTQLLEMQSKPTALHTDFTRKLIPLAEMDVQQFKPHFNEFDTFGFVFRIEDATNFQLVFIVDALKNILCIKFWGNTQQHAYDDIVQINKFLVISQLEWRPQNRFYRCGLPQAFVNEITLFTENPKSIGRVTALATLKEKFDAMNLSDYIEECCEKLGTDVQSNKENSSSNTSKTFDTSLNQTILSRTAPIPSPHVDRVLQKTERLKQCGSPPVFRSSYLRKGDTPNGSRKPFKNPSRAQ